MYYFAYGSNLDRAQMARRCPTSQFVRTTYLSGWGLEFAGYSGTRRGPVATIGRSHGLVWGALYKMSHRDWVALDRCEGSAYERVPISVGGLRAETYVMSPAAPGIPPLSYICQIYRASLELELPTRSLMPWLDRSAQRGEIIRSQRARADILRILAHLRSYRVCQNRSMRGRKSALTEKVFKEPTEARSELLAELVTQNGNVTATARALKISRRTLYRYIEHFSLVDQVELARGVDPQPGLW